METFNELSKEIGFLTNKRNCVINKKKEKELSITRIPVRKQSLLLTKSPLISKAILLNVTRTGITSLKKKSMSASRVNQSWRLNFGEAPVKRGNVIFFPKEKKYRYSPLKLYFVRVLQTQKTINVAVYNYATMLINKLIRLYYKFF